MYPFHHILKLHEDVKQRNINHEKYAADLQTVYEGGGTRIHRSWRI